MKVTSLQKQAIACCKRCDRCTCSTVLRAPAQPAPAPGPSTAAAAAATTAAVTGLALPAGMPGQAVIAIHFDHHVTGSRIVSACEQIFRACLLERPCINRKGGIGYDKVHKMYRLSKQFDFSSADTR